MLCLLSQLAHNLIRWVQLWMLDENIGDHAADRSPCPAYAQSAMALSRPKSSFAGHHRTDKKVHRVQSRYEAMWSDRCLRLSGQVAIDKPVGCKSPICYWTLLTH